MSYLTDVGGDNVELVYEFTPTVSQDGWQSHATPSDKFSVLAGAQSIVYCVVCSIPHPLLHGFYSTSSTQHPSLNIIYPTSSTQHPLLHILYSTSSTPHPPLNILYSTSSTQHPLLHILYSTSSTPQSFPLAVGY